MSQVAKPIRLDTDDQVVDRAIAWTTEASREAVDFVLSQQIDTPENNGHDGRSPWIWLRLANGDLGLVTFPHGETYVHVSEGGDAEMTYP